MFTLPAVNDTLLPPCCKQSASVQALEWATTGFASGSAGRPSGRGAGGHVVFQVGLADPDAAAPLAETEGPQPARADGVADRALADAQDAGSLADGQQAPLLALAGGEAGGLVRWGGAAG
ncbi:MAG: hypothetical protein ABSG53_25115, partial [Thermoguttaceae bacterium]